MPGTPKEITPGSNGADRIGITRRDFLILTAAAGAGALAAAAEPGIRVLTALAAPLEGGGGGADALKELPEEIQQLLADKAQLPIGVKKSFRLWKEPNDANQSLVIVRIDDKDTVTGYAVTPNDWFFGTMVDDQDTDKVPKWGFFTKEREYADFDESLAEKMVRLNTDQIKAIQKGLWPDLPTEPVKPVEAVKAGELSVNGSKFEIDGHEAWLRGAVAPTFIWSPRAGMEPGFMYRFAKELRVWGANFIIVDWNSAFLDDPVYPGSLVAMLEFLKNQGFVTELNLHSRGCDPNNPYAFNQILSVDDALEADWIKLLSNSELLRTIKKTVSIFGILSESTMPWEASLPVYDRIADKIRTMTGKPDAICAYSGPEYGGDARGLLNIAPTRKNTAIEIHPWKWIADRSGLDYMNQLRQNGYCVFIGEAGLMNGNMDEYPYLENLMAFVVNNRIPFALWGLMKGNGEQDRFFQFDQAQRKYVLTPLGQLMKNTLEANINAA